MDTVQIEADMRKNLVIAAVGDESMHRHWKPVKDYDLALVYYGDQKGYPEENQTKAKGTKFALIHNYLSSRPEVFNYQYIWMPDDDIVLDSEGIEKMFQMAEQYDLWICQPSIMGWYGLDITLHHKNSILRYTNYVEIMCPCFQTKALQQCMGTFRENKTGWGIDHMWNKMLGHPTDKIAILDDIVAVHTRPMGGGDMYKNQANGTMAQAQQENKEVWTKYKIGQSSYEDLKRGRLVSVESFDKHYHNLVEYGRIYKQTEAGVDLPDRIWPPGEITHMLCDQLRAN